MRKFLSNSKFSNRPPGDLIKNVLVFGLLVLLAYLVGNGLLETISGYSLGRLVRNMLPAFFVGILLIFIVTLEDFGFLRGFWSRPEITIRKVIPIGLAAVFFGMLLPLAIGWGLIECMAILAVILAFFLSLYFMVSGKGFYAVITFLFTFPFLSLIEYWLIYIPLNFRWGPITLTPTIAFLLVLFFLSLFPQKSENPKPYMPASLKWAILIFLSICLISSILSINPLKSLQAVYLEFVCPLILFFVILKNLQEEKQVKILAYSMVASGMLISFISLYFFIRHFWEGHSTTIGQIKGTFFAGGLHIGSLISIVLMVLAIAIVLYYLRSSKRLKLIISGSIGFFFVTALISFVRTALLSMFVLLAVLTIAKRPRRAIFIILILFGIGLLPYISFVKEYIEYNFPNISSINDIRYMSTISYRINAWRAGLEMVKDYPVLGIGTGLWDEYIPKYGTMQPVVISLDPLKMGWGYINDPHNFYIRIALDSGLIGFIALIFILVIIFKSAIKTVLFTKEESRYYLTLGSIAGLLAYLTWGLSGAGFVDEGLSNIGVGIFFFSLGAIVIKLSHFEREHPKN